MVLQVRAVLALEVFGTFTDVVGRQVEASAAVQTRTVEAVIDIQLWTERTIQLLTVTNDTSAFLVSMAPVQYTSPW